MGIITKEDGKNRVSLMVRMPQGMAEVIDSAVGILYTSRPDFVIEAVRRFIHHVCNEEAGIMLYLQDKKDADRDVRLEFYRESIREKTELFRNSAAEAAAKSKRDVDILLSLPKGLASEIDRTVERTGCFRNHHEFVKSATIYLLLQMATDNTNAMLTESFLESNQATSDLREQIARMKREMSGLEDRPDKRSHGIRTPHPGGFEPRGLQIHALQQGEGYKAGALGAPHAERDGFPRLQAQLEEGARKTGHSRQAVPREAEPRRGADLHLQHGCAPQGPDTAAAPPRPGKDTGRGPAEVRGGPRSAPEERDACVLHTEILGICRYLKKNVVVQLYLHSVEDFSLGPAFGHKYVGRDT